MKSAFITGASRGIGKGIALTLAEMGFRVVLAAKDKVKLEQVAHEITSMLHLESSREPLVYALDVSNEKQVNRAVHDAHAHTKQFDVLFNGAGIARSGTSELTHDDLLAMLQINLMGTFLCVKAIAPYMKKRQSGYIFNVASRAGKIGISTLGGYAASKFGVVGLGESLYNELISYGIKVTTLCPGYVNTEMASKSSIPNEEKIPVSDIVKTVQFLLGLSANGCIKEIVMDCRKTTELANEALLKGR